MKSDEEKFNDYIHNNPDLYQLIKKERNVLLLRFFEGIGVSYEQLFEKSKKYTISKSVLDHAITGFKAVGIIDEIELPKRLFFLTDKGKELLKMYDMMKNSHGV